MAEKRVQFQNIVENQLPTYVQTEFPLVSDFLKSYYVSQEFQGGTTDLIDNFGLSFMVENRYYKSKDEDILTFDSWEDELHNGRKHNEFNLSLWIDKKINNKLINQIKIKYRDRSIESDYYWISDYKEFNK